MLAADGADSGPVETVIEALRAEGAICEVLAPHEGTLEGGLDVDRGLLTMASVLYDGVLVAGGRESVDTLRRNGAAIRYVAEAYKHGKAIGALGDGVDLLREAPLNDAQLADNGLVAEHGTVTLASTGDGDLDEFAAAFAHAIGTHRHFDRRPELVPV